MLRVAISPTAGFLWAGDGRRRARSRFESDDKAPRVTEADAAPGRGTVERRADPPTSLVTLGPLLILLSVTVGSALGPGLAWAGALKGIVRLTGTALPEARKVQVTTDQYVCGKEKDAEDLVVSRDRGIKNAVVWLQTAPPGTK
jgi:hypothetical protein